MAWSIEVNSFGTKETHESVAETLLEAVEDALTVLAFDGNDEGSYTITVESQ